MQPQPIYSLPQSQPLYPQQHIQGKHDKLDNRFIWGRTKSCCQTAHIYEWEGNSWNKRSEQSYLYYYIHIWSKSDAVQSLYKIFVIVKSNKLQFMGKASSVSWAIQPSLCRYHFTIIVCINQCQSLRWYICCAGITTIVLLLSLLMQLYKLAYMKYTT